MSGAVGGAKGSWHPSDRIRLPPLFPGHCTMCGAEVTGRRPDGSRKEFCSRQCIRRFDKLTRKHGQRLLRLALYWRLHRGRKGTPGQGRQSDMAALADYALLELRT